jgi:hypothetical protein
MDLIAQLVKDGWKVSISHDGRQFILTLARAGRFPFVPDDSYSYKGANLDGLCALAYGGAPDSRG